MVLSAELQPHQTADAAPYDFNQISLHTLATAPPDILDHLPFGIIGMSANGVVQIYNATEAKLAGLPPAKVLGGHFFENIAQCMNNYMIAQRFIDEPELDATINFVLTLRMRPTPVKLRMLQSKSVDLHFVLIHRTR